MELSESGYHAYAWRCLLTVSAEDCWRILTQETWAFWQAFLEINPHGSRDKTCGRSSLAKAAMLLAAAKKSRDADHLANLVHDTREIDDETLEWEAEARKHTEPIRGYPFDCHAARGRKAGKTERDFFLQECGVLVLGQPGALEDDTERLRQSSAGFPTRKRC